MGTNVTKMGTRKIKEKISPALFGKTRRSILGLLYSHADDSFYLRQIIRETGSGSGAVQRELKNLTRAGIIKHTREGGQIYYQANPNCPIFGEIKSIVIKTVAIGEVLEDKLSKIKDKIKLAFLFGSIVNGEENSSSDVDLMIIGDIKFAKITAILNPIQEKIRREINPIVYPPEEFRQKLNQNHHFIKSIMKEEKIFLIGEENELTKLVG